MRDDYPPKAELLSRRHARVSAILELLDLLAEIPSPPPWIAAAKAKATKRIETIEAAQAALADELDLPEGG